MATYNETLSCKDIITDQCLFILRTEVICGVFDDLNEVYGGKIYTIMTPVGIAAYYNNEWAGNINGLYPWQGAIIYLSEGVTVNYTGDLITNDYYSEKFIDSHIGQFRMFLS